MSTNSDVLGSLAAVIPGATTTTGTTPAAPGAAAPVPEGNQIPVSFDDMSHEQVLETARRLMDENTTLSESEIKWRALARKHEKAAKASRAATPEGVHTGDQTPAATPTGDTAEAERLRQENLQLTVAIKKGLPADLAFRLRGDDEDELLEDADRLIALIKPGRTSNGSADGGARTAPPAPQTPADAFVDALKQAMR